MNGIPIARVLGFEIRLHASWIFIVAVVTAIVAGRLGEFQPETSQPIVWLIGLLGSIGFLVTVVIHELAHGLAARRDGTPPGTLLVQFIGSPQQADVTATSPRAEATIALAGPVSSLLIGAALTGLTVALLEIGGGTLAPIADVLFIVGALNLVLAGVSVLPSFPLDGGRLVRAIAWAATRSVSRGTKTAGVVGRWFGRSLMGVGLGVIVLGTPIDGLMIGLAGWFLLMASRSVDRYVVLEDLIKDAVVGDAMEPDLKTLAPQLTLDTFADELLDGSVGPALPVVRGDDVVGIVGTFQVRRVRRKLWPETRAEDVMIRPPDLLTVGPDEALTLAIERLRTSRLEGLPVLDAGALRGVLTRRSVAELLHARADRRGVTM
jgi:Zn-dependent protease